MRAETIRSDSFEKAHSGLWLPKANVHGVYHARLIRDGEVVDEFDFPNLVVNEGLDYLAAAALSGGSQVTSWYLAPFTGNYTPVSTDTAATIPGNATETTAYTSSTRVAFAGVEGSQEVTNSASPANFTFNATSTIYGAYLISAATKLSTSGTLFSAAQFSAPKNVSSGDQLLLTYTFQAASA